MYWPIDLLFLGHQSHIFIVFLQEGKKKIQMPESHAEKVCFSLKRSLITPFLAHLSWQLNWAFLIAWCPSFVRLSVNFSHFHLFLQKCWANFNQLGTKHQSILGWRGFYFFSNERSFPREDNYEIAKIHWQNSKIFSRTAGLISTKLLNTNYLTQNIFWWRGFKFVQIKGHSLFQREIIMK